MNGKGCAGRSRAASAAGRYSEEGSSIQLRSLLLSADVDQNDGELGQSLAQVTPDRLLIDPSFETVSLMRTSCSSGVSPSGLRSVIPSRTWALMPATRTMKNSSRLLAEIDRKRTRSSAG